MNCAESQELSINYAFEKLSPEQALNLEIHLQHCDNCKIAYKQNANVQRVIQELKSHAPTLKGKSSAINTILQEISAEDSFLRKRSTQISIPKILRSTINFAAIFLIGLFVIQQYEIRTSLEMLNSKIESQKVESNANNSPIETIKLIPVITQTSVTEKIELSDEQVLKFLEEYKSLLDENKRLFHFLEKKHPLVYKELLKSQNEKEEHLQNL